MFVVDKCTRCTADSQVGADTFPAADNILRCVGAIMTGDAVTPPCLNNYLHSPAPDVTRVANLTIPDLALGFQNSPTEIYHSARKSQHPGFGT